MNRYVLDASALLTVLNFETGAEKVTAILDRSLISSVNAAEVLSKLADRGIPLKAVIEDFESLGLEIIDFDLAQAVIAAELRPKTKTLGLSLGDRSCLALALRENAVAITADRNWGKIKWCPVELIR